MSGISVVGLPISRSNGPGNGKPGKGQGVRAGPRNLTAGWPGDREEGTMSGESLVDGCEPAGHAVRRLRAIHGKMGGIGRIAVYHWIRTRPPTRNGRCAAMFI